MLAPVSFAKQRGVVDGGDGSGGGIPESSSSQAVLTASSSCLSSRLFFMVTAVVVSLAVVLFRNSSSTTTSAAAAATGAIIINNNNNNNNPILSVPRATTTTFRKAALEEPNAIVQGLWRSEAYYHCPANTIHNVTSTKKVQDIVLWHGASFTKEEWKSRGILEKLCSVDHFSVTALDLSHNSNHQALVDLLNGLQEQKLLSLPVAAIVTPSASGAGIVDWINNGASIDDLTSFMQSVQLWVPVACGSVTDLDPGKMEQLKNAEFPVLAIHGNEDSSGNRQSMFLAYNMGAQVVEIQGGHPCYLQSPDTFVETLTKKLESLENAS